MKFRININDYKEQIRRFSRRTWIIIGASVIVVIFVASLVVPVNVEVATYEALKGEFIIDQMLQGEIDAVNSTSVSVPRLRRHMSLQIVDMAEEGSEVKKGDFLIQMDNSAAVQKVDEAKDNVANAKAQLESEKASISSNMAQLQSQLETQNYSYQQSELSLKMMQFEAASKRQEADLNMRKAEVSLHQAEEKIESQKIIDRASLMKAELNVRQAENELREAEQGLEKLTLKAPLDGLVVYQEIWGGSGMKKVQIGDTPWPGMPVVKIPDLSVMQAKTTVSEVAISQIEKDQNAVITVDALEGKTYYGKISRVAALARRERNTNVKVFDVEVTIDSTDGQLRPGMTCDCRIITNRIPDALTVPLQAIFQKEGKTVVFVMGARGPRMKEVVIGEKSQDNIVITEGIEEGDRVCLRDPTIPLEDLGGDSDSAPVKNKPKKSSGNRSMVIIG